MSDSSAWVTIARRAHEVDEGGLATLCGLPVGTRVVRARRRGGRCPNCMFVQWQSTRPEEKTRLMDLTPEQEKIRRRLNAEASRRAYARTPTTTATGSASVWTVSGGLPTLGKRR
ncbi:hypothetical protein ACFFGH_10800 [Lysobacter korlensis]|uniref:Uncharacterized protein n=1 Tax=Lysobacter korlensis TaxID=553636 RepID=A0ABV6RQY2_9GAMM